MDELWCSEQRTYREAKYQPPPEGSPRAQRSLRGDMIWFLNIGVNDCVDQVLVGRRLGRFVAVVAKQWLTISVPLVAHRFCSYVAVCARKIKANFCLLQMSHSSLTSLAANRNVKELGSFCSHSGEGPRTIRWDPPITHITGKSCRYDISIEHFSLGPATRPSVRALWPRVTVSY